MYPRMLTTAAQAWNRSGRTEFWKHVLVIEPVIPDTLPTLLIKMQPWTADDIKIIVNYINRKKIQATGRPQPKFPSDRVYAGHVFQVPLQNIGPETRIEGVQLLVGTYGQDGLPYGITAEVVDAEGNGLRQGKANGKWVKDNSLITINFTNKSDAKLDGKLKLRISAPQATETNSFSVWLAGKDQASMNLLPGELIPDSVIVFNPLDQTNNLVPNEFLSTPFPYKKAKQLPWNITPVSDYSPYFGMIRKHLSPIQASKANMLDGNTADILNRQMQDGYPKDWIHLIVVAGVSIVFSLLFIAIPLFRTNIRQVVWNGMSRDIAYFACLGLGFIMIEVVFIQLFMKLIGFPTHTFVLVISTMLLSAGLGSMYSQRFLQLVNNKTPVVFAIILLYGLAFILSFEGLFYYFLSFPLPVRLLCGVVMIAPLGFFMGMPFPIGVLGLSGSNETAITWAWALNGFFTVLGGYLAIVISIFSSFTIVLGTALLIYGCALLVVRRNLPDPVFGPTSNR